MTGLSGSARPLLAVGVFAASSVLTATAAAAAPAPPPSAGASALSVRDCAATGGSPWLDALGRAWCVGGVYTGTRLR